MDTSETYIKMSDCSEIQDKHKRQVGDWIAHIDDDGKWSASPITLMMPTFMGYYDNMVWLPSQGDLQEMIRKIHHYSDYGLIHQMNHFVWGEDGESDLDNHNCYSMEQLWLAFVMLQLHQKRWCNGEWTDDTRNT